MADASQDSSLPPAKPAWTEGQKRAILSGFANLNSRLDELNAAVERSDSQSVFAKYDNDMTPEDIRAIRAGFAKLRQAMSAQLQDAGIAQNAPRSSLRWLLRVNLTYMAVALADLAPKNLRAYGPLDPAAKAAAEGMQESLAECFASSRRASRRAEGTFDPWPVADGLL